MARAGGDGQASLERRGHCAQEGCHVGHAGVERIAVVALLEVKHSVQWMLAPEKPEAQDDAAADRRVRGQRVAGLEQWRQGRRPRLAPRHARSHLERGHHQRASPRVSMPDAMYPTGSPSHSRIRTSRRNR